MDFYIATGAMLSLGGPAAPIFAYGFLGLLAYLVLDGLSNMLALWPVAGAVHVFVETFVDEHTGKAVGILYW